MRVTLEGSKIDQPGRHKGRDRQDLEQARLRQPMQFSNHSVGVVAVTAPSEPSMIMQPFTSAMRSLGYQMTMGLEPGHQCGGNAESYHCAPDKKFTEVRCVPKQRSAANRNDQQSTVDPPWSIPIQQHSNGELSTRKDKKRASGSLAHGS
jgi:hypothetical protein